MENLLDVSGACKYLKIGRNKLYRMIKSGKINAADVSDGKQPCYRIEKSEIDKYITLRQLEKSLGVRSGSITEMKKHIK
jgi:excisionase family DNA binding protein